LSPALGEYAHDPLFVLGHGPPTLRLAALGAVIGVPMRSRPRNPPRPASDADGAQTAEARRYIADY
jgi:hypothetical protein